MPGLPGEAKSVKRFERSLMDWILRYIRTTFTFLLMFVAGDADWWWFNMADGHESAVVYEERYDHHKVSFYIDLFESGSAGKPAGRPCPPEQVRPTDGESTAPSDQGYNTWEERSCDVTVVDDDGSRHAGAERRHDSQGDVEAGDGVVSEVEEANTLESILATFERHELSFRKHFLVPEPATEAPASPPAIRQTSQYIGLEHLDSLVRIMTQLSQLRDENSHLRKRCDFLTNTKSLMKIQNDMVHVKSMRSKAKPHTRLMQYLSTPAHTLRTRDSSRSLVSPESSIASVEPVVMRKAVKLHHRSQSMGSIDLLDIDLDDAAENHKNAEKPAKERGMRSRENKKSKRFSKWYRMKKVFTGKPEPSHKPESSGTISAEQLMKVNRRQHTISGSPRDKSPPKLRHTTSVDAVVLSPSDNSSLDISRSVSQSTPSPQPPCSPCSFQSEPPMVLPGSADISDMLDDVAVAPSAEEAGATDGEVHSPHIKRCASVASLSSDEEEEAAELEDTSVPVEELVSDDGEEPVTRYLSVTTSSEPTRQSSTQSLHYSSTSDEKDAFFATRPLTPETGYSSVMEIPHDSETDHGEMLGEMYDDEFGITDMSMNPDDESTCSDAQKNRRSAWYRVKEIIHTRRDSLKGKTAQLSATSSSWQDNLADSPIEGEISPESGSWADQKLGHYDPEDYTHEKSGSDGPTSPTSESPKLIRRYMSTKNRGRSPRMASPNRKRHSLKTSAELIYPPLSSKTSQEYPAFLGEWRVILSSSLVGV